MGWYVSHHDGREGADVYSGFHSGGYAEEVYFFYQFVFVFEEYALKESLAFGGVFFGGLPG
ncbi:MAG: hypothetical protein LUG51_00055 [Tannerellaceae bacterium]|nr:hypothetical protein [Tannerellaceae bacterium]